VGLGSPQDIPLETIVHRVGGGGLANLRLSDLDRQEIPPGISVLLGGTPAEAAKQMRQTFPRSRKWRVTAGTVGSTTAAAIRQAGFDVVPDPTTRFPNHARLTHRDGIGGFVDENLAKLVQAFDDTLGC